jgi:hypothetical protein
MSPGVASLVFLSIMIGVFCGCAMLATTTNSRFAPNPQQGRYQETRMLLMLPGAVVGVDYEKLGLLANEYQALPIGLFWLCVYCI